mmetsp:Transcript_136347/g.221874  ORF Transcript_136347/g.221874 Transcript_136347/m.221874 type:complete len:916 (-) Transcript_136347:133-2880(-)
MSHSVLCGKSCPAAWRRYCLLVGTLLALQAASQETTTSFGPNKIWPDDIENLDTAGLREQTKEVCDRSGSRAREDTKELEQAVRNRDEFEPVGFTDIPGGPHGFVARLLKMRGPKLVPSAFIKVVTSCAPGDEESVSASGGCYEDWKAYFMRLCVPFALPILVGAAASAVHIICCFVACCRCCRRMPCCRERLVPRHATRPKQVATFVFWVAASVSSFGLGASIHGTSFVLHRSLNWQMCTALQLANEAVGGAEDLLFLGTEQGHANLVAIAEALDVDGTVMRTVRKVIDRTFDFADKHEKLRRRTEHFARVLNRSGPAHRSFEHRCVFCSLALGDANNVVPGFPEEGLLPALEHEIGESSSEAMDHIRRYTHRRLTGSNLTALASKVKRAIGAMGILNDALRAALIDTWPRRLPTADAIEFIRMVLFVLVGLGAMAGSVFGWGAMFITRLRLRKRPDVIPSGKPHCAAWCFGFVYACCAAFIGGCFVMGGIFTGEGCIFLREHLLTFEGIGLYSRTIGLKAVGDTINSPGIAVRQAQAQLSVDLARTCFAENGTGDMLRVLELDEKLAFQPDLSSAFWRLDERVAEPPSGRKTAELIEAMRDAAATFGGLFVLDPLPLDESRNGSLGILELNPNVRGLLLGSSVTPDDTKAPDGRTELQGLNAYAALIAGPGKYTFSHGTAGGGFVITSVRPTDAELASLPNTVRNALLYARAKEKLLESTNSLRCDELDDAGGVTERLCSVKEFHEYVSAEVDRLAQAADNSAAAAVLVQRLFLTELRTQLSPTLRKVRDLRGMLHCSFLWRRIETFDKATCDSFAPAVARCGVNLLSLAACAFAGIFVQYKVWRHLKDNKVVGQELDRFDKTYQAFRKKMDALEAERQDKMSRAKEYARQIQDMNVMAISSGVKNRIVHMES